MESAGADVGSAGRVQCAVVHVCVACPLSRLGAGGNDRARAVTPGFRLQIALLIFCLFSSINTLSCGTEQSTPGQFFHNILSEAVTFLFLCSASQSKLLSVLDMLSKS